MTIAHPAAEVHQTYLVLVIGHGVYDVEEITSNDPSIIKALRLTKCFDDMGHYNLSVGILGCTCDCASQTYVKGPEGKCCKHLRAAMNAGLFAPAMVTLDSEGRVTDVSRDEEAPSSVAEDLAARDHSDALESALHRYHEAELDARLADSHEDAQAARVRAFDAWVDLQDFRHDDDAPGEADDRDEVTAEDRDFWAAESDRLARIEAMATYYAELGEAEYEAIREESYRSGLAFPEDWADDDFELGEGVEILGHLAYAHRTEG